IASRLLYFGSCGLPQDYLIPGELVSESLLVTGSVTDQVALLAQGFVDVAGGRDAHIEFPRSFRYRGHCVVLLQMRCDEIEITLLGRRWSGHAHALAFRSTTGSRFGRSNTMLSFFSPMSHSQLSCGVVSRTSAGRREIRTTNSSSVRDSRPGYSRARLMICVSVVGMIKPPPSCDQSFGKALPALL